MPWISQERSLDTVHSLQFYGYAGEKPAMSGVTVYDGGAQFTNSYRNSKLNPAWDYDNLSGPELRKEAQKEGARALSGSSYDNGHEFATVKYSTTLTHQHVVLNYPTGGTPLVYEGPVNLNHLPKMTHIRLPIDGSDIPNMNILGTRLISQTIPTSPHAGMAQFLGELREGLPHLMGHALSQNLKNPLKGIGGEHLNMEFAVKPMVSDLQKFARAVKDMNKLLRQYLRDSGKQVRRKRSLPVEMVQSEPEVYACNAYIPAFPSGYNITNQFLLQGGYTPVTIFDRIETKVRFSGAYTYTAVQDSIDLYGYMKQWDQKANYLLGTRFTAETLWELTPWSWLVDWFSSIGNVISNAEALSSDNLVLRYGYLMHETHAVRTCISQPIPVNTYDGPVGPIVYEYVSTRKLRKRATPYGFGIDVNALSAKRLAILAALGLSRGPSNLG